MIETKPSDVIETSGKMKDVAKQSGRLETDKGKKQSPVVLFSERHRRQRLAKLYTWVKLRQQQQQQKKNRKQKQPKRNEGERTNGGEFERVRRVWDCVTIKEK